MGAWDPLDAGSRVETKETTGTGLPSWAALRCHGRHSSQLLRDTACFGAPNDKVAVGAPLAHSRVNDRKSCRSQRGDACSDRGGANLRAGDLPLAARARRVVWASLDSKLVVLVQRDSHATSVVGRLPVADRGGFG
jgi:hypothetical protein